MPRYALTLPLGPLSFSISPSSQRSPSPLTSNALSIIISPSQLTHLFLLNLRSRKCSSRLKRLLLVCPSLCPFSPQAPTVGCVLCAFVVKLFPFTLVAPLHGTRAVPARLSTTSRSTAAHPSRDVRHPCGAFLALRAAPNSVDPFQSHDTIKYDVNKCTYLYGQPPSSALHHPPCRSTKTRHMWVAKCGSLRRSLSLAVLHPSSLTSCPLGILHPFQCGKCGGVYQPPSSPYLSLLHLMRRRKEAM